MTTSERKRRNKQTREQSSHNIDKTLLDNGFHTGSGNFCTTGSLAQWSFPSQLTFQQQEFPLGSDCQAGFWGFALLCSMGRAHSLRLFCCSSPNNLPVVAAVWAMVSDVLDVCASPPMLHFGFVTVALSMHC